MTEASQSKKDLTFGQELIANRKQHRLQIADNLGNTITVRVLPISPKKELPQKLRWLQPLNDRIFNARWKAMHIPTMNDPVYVNRRSWSKQVARGKLAKDVTKLFFEHHKLISTLMQTERYTFAQTKAIIDAVEPFLPTWKRNAKDATHTLQPTEGEMIQVTYDPTQKDVAIQLQHLGEGQFKTVYLEVLFHKGTARAHLQMQDQAYQHLLAEQHATLSKYDSPYIIRSTNIGDQYYLEFMNKGDLASESCKCELQKNPARRRQVMRDVCKGIQAVHTKNRVHNDIKPGNVLVDNQWNVKLTDFDCESQENQNLLAGTPLYMSPSKLLFYSTGNPWYTTCAHDDIWALGMTYYETKHGFSKDLRQEFHKINQSKYQITAIKEFLTILVRSLDPRDQEDQIILACFRGDGLLQTLQNVPQELTCLLGTPCTISEIIQQLENIQTQ